MAIEDSEILRLVHLVRRHGTDLTNVEVKASHGGLPKSLRETLSAFSNGDGGIVILGLDESTGFQPVESFEPAAIRDSLADACNNEMQPPVRAEIEILEIDGSSIVVAVVPELDLRSKPCFVKARGELNGSFIRGGDGDRRLTEYEIFLLHANAGQPRDDVAAVPMADVTDLDSEALARLLRRVRSRQPRAFGDVADEVALRRLGVLVPDGDRLVPSVAGLLALGQYPQEFFPQLNVTFVVIPGTSKDTVPADGPRFLDNRSLNGSIPVMVDAALTALISNMSTRAVVHGAGREDVYDYPVEALREAVVNALMHRDYSGWAHGTQVQIEMYADRLVMRNPGGLYGTVTEDDLGEEGVASSRNSYLSTLLQDVTLPGTDRVVCENRGTGIPTMLSLLRRAGLSPPRFDSKVSHFSVTFPKHTLLGAETIEWIKDLGQPGLTDAQCLALALMREGRRVSNARLRQLGLDSREATGALSDLVNRGLAVRTGGRRHAAYILADDERERGQDDGLPSRISADRSEQIKTTLAGDAAMRLGEIAEAIGLGKAMTARHLERLVDSGDIIATGPPRSRNRRYRLARDQPH